MRIARQCHLNDDDEELWRITASRAVHVAGITPHPDNSWMMQVARNITDVDDGFLRGNGYLLGGAGR
jgi:hypothetical protein